MAVLVAPKFDDATEYSYAWSREVSKWLIESGWQVIDLGGREVTRSEVEQALKQYPTALYVHYNHGGEEEHYGSMTEAVVDLNNVTLLSGRETYSMNCLSAKKLGVEAWRNGAKAYWGYAETFGFSTEAIDAFGQFANCGIKYWLEGKSYKESLDSAKNLATELSEQLLAEGKYLASVLMLTDGDALRCYNGEPPTSECTFRKIAIRLFGPKIGWNLKGFLRENSYNFIFFLLGFTIFFLGWGQIDVMCFPKIDWSRTRKGEVFPYIYMYEADAYMLFLSSIVIGYFISIISVWFWMHQYKKRGSKS